MDKFTDKQSSKEINIFQIVQVLARYKKLFLSAFILIFVVCFAAGHFKPQRYTYIQTLYLGSYLQDENKTFFTTSFFAFNEIKSAFIPQAVQQYEAQYNQKINQLNYQAVLSGNPLVVNLTSGTTLPVYDLGTVDLKYSGALTDKNAFIAINQQILQRIQARELPQFNLLKNNTMTQINFLSKNIEQLQELSKKIAKNSNEANAKNSLILLSNLQIQTSLTSLNLELLQQQAFLQSLVPSSLGEVIVIKNDKLSFKVLAVLSIVISLLGSFIIVMFIYFVRTQKQIF